MSNKSEPVARKTIQSMVRAAFHFGERPERAAAIAEQGE